MLNRYISKEAYIPRYRSHEYTTALDMKIRELGGEILYNTRVEEIVVENGEVAGVKTSHGDIIKTARVIANTSPHTVYSRLIHPREAVPRLAWKTCNARKVGFSALVVYLGLDKSPEELGLKEYSYFIYNNPDNDKIYEQFHKLGRPAAQATVCLNNAVPHCSPPGTTILYLTTLFSGEAWSKVSPQDYFEVKNKIAGEMIEDLEEALNVSIRDSIEEVEVATPATFAHYTGAFNGSIYGYEPAPWDSILPRMMTMNDEKYIKGLDFAGGFAFRCHGYSSSLQSGETAALLMHKDLMEVK